MEKPSVTLSTGEEIGADVILCADGVTVGTIISLREKEKKGEQADISVVMGSIFHCPWLQAQVVWHDLLSMAGPVSRNGI